MNEEFTALAERWSISGALEAPERAEILVIGAYTGITMAWLAKTFPGFKRIIGFEPQEWACREARKRFNSLQLESLWIINYALGDESRGLMTKFPMVEFGTDACSFINEVSQRQPGEGLITEAAQVLPLFYPDDQKIDLCIMNIEGGEFELLPHLIKTGWLRKINRIAVQWHLGLRPELDELRMDAEIHWLEETGLVTKVDDSPEWTYHVR
jgi:FkbM family methyltransferase